MDTISLWVVICALAGLCQACQMPPPGPDIDWTKILGKRWYEVATGRPTAKKYYGRCTELVFEKKIPGGYTDTVFLKNSTGDVEHTHSRVMKTLDGYYTVLFGEENPEDILNAMKQTKMSVQRRQDVSMPKLAYYTDHENYFLILGCSPDVDNHRDYMELWYYGPNRHPSAEDILRVTNKLGEIGRGWSELQLVLDECITT